MSRGFWKARPGHPVGLSRSAGSSATSLPYVGGSGELAALLYDSFEFKETSGPRLGIMNRIYASQTGTIRYRASPAGIAAKIPSGIDLASTNCLAIDQTGFADQTSFRTASYTITGWLYIDSFSASANSLIFGDWAHSTGSLAHAIWIQANTGADARKLVFGASSNGSSGAYSATTALSASTLYFFAAVRTAGVDIRMRLDSTWGAADTFTGNIYTVAGSIGIGNHPTTTTWITDGYLGQLSFWNAAMSETQLDVVRAAGAGIAIRRAA